MRRERYGRTGSGREAEERLAERVRVAMLGEEVGRALTQSADLQETLQSCAEAMVQPLDAAFARIWTLDESGQVLQLRAGAGMYTRLNGTHSRIPMGRLKIGRSASHAAGARFKLKASPLWGRASMSKSHSKGMRKIGLARDQRKEELLGINGGRHRDGCRSRTQLAHGVISRHANAPIPRARQQERQRILPAGVQGNGRAARRGLKSDAIAP